MNSNVDATNLNSVELVNFLFSNYYNFYNSTSFVIRHGKNKNNRKQIKKYLRLKGFSYIENQNDLSIEIVNPY